MAVAELSQLKQSSSRVRYRQVTFPSTMAGTAPEFGPEKKLTKFVRFDTELTDGLPLRIMVKRWTEYGIGSRLSVSGNTVYV